MKNFNYFIGIDVSKETLDFCCYNNGKKTIETKINNQQKSIRAYLKKLIADKLIDIDTSIFCMEHTGIYNNHLLKVFLESNINVWLENPIHLKRSLGLVRGKNDKVDAERIAMFAYKNRESIKLWQPERTVIIKLKHLLKTRERLLDAIESIEMPIKEITSFTDKETVRMFKKSSKASISGIRKDIKTIDHMIKETINSDEHVKELFKIISSVENVGTIITTAVICYTNEFKKFNSPKKFACYSGIAPFEHSSGRSIRGKTRTSFMANKFIKKLLHLSALSAVSRPGELRDYFERKVAEGKNKMLVLNAIRNKIILRIFACVNQNKIFEKNIKNNLILA